MIGQICEAFNCSPDVALRQDYELCEQIMLMRNYAELSNMEQRDPKSLTGDHRKFVISLERAAGVIAPAQARV